MTALTGFRGSEGKRNTLLREARRVAEQKTERSPRPFSAIDSRRRDANCRLLIADYLSVFRPLSPVLCS
ncbi:MAG: hypothetical protein LBJ76_01835, partial [Candidatus Accumulibacter sp.]|nr:hypothetical protein [Accumulibacter sp.]